MRLFLKLLVVLISGAGIIAAQGVKKEDTVPNNAGDALENATIWVCKASAPDPPPFPCVSAERAPVFSSITLDPATQMPNSQLTTGMNGRWRGASAGVH